MYFYPRSPCGERLVFVGFFMAQNLFLSTLSLRRATRYRHISFRRFRFLSTLSLRRATPNTTRCRVIRSYFYPRSPCGERPLSGSSRATVLVFLSTLSLRRATRSRGGYITKIDISIHALLAESDIFHVRSFTSKDNFYPRSPCGERLSIECSYHNIKLKFLSTLSLRRATLQEKFS